MTGMSSFPASTGRPALDLCNTRLGERDLLAGPDDLGRWFVVAALADHPPRVTRSELEAARVLRDGVRAALLAEDGPRLASLAEEWLDRAPGSNSSTMRKYSRTVWGHPETAPERLRASVCQRRTSFSL